VACLFVFGLAILLRAERAARTEEYHLIYMQTHYRIDSLACGVLLGWWGRYRGFRMGWAMTPLTVVVIAAASAVAYLVPRSAMPGAVICYTALFLAFGVLVAGAAATPGWGAGHWLTWVGRYSYTIYLAQATAQFLSETRWAKSAYFDYRGLVFVAVTIGLGWLLARFVEQPMLRLRDRVAPAR
jgi:peptidoglycan/LPS O-acetylase OafA/YrhL